MPVVFQSVKSKGDYRLPASFNREIGRIVVRWAYFEGLIQQMIWGVAFSPDALGASLGRISTVEPKFPVRLDLLSRLATVRRVGYDAKLLKSIRKKSQKLNEERNLIAHGRWTKIPDLGWLVQETRGTWQSGKGAPVGIKKITPEAKSKSLADLAKIVTDLESLIGDARELQISLHYLPKP